MRFNKINKQAGLILAHVCVFLAVIGIFFTPVTHYTIFTVSSFSVRKKV